MLDRSGSMHGEPLLEAVRCARYIVEQLAPTDIASIVVFDDRINVLAGAQPSASRQALHSALAHILAGGSTSTRRLASWCQFSARQRQSGGNGAGHFAFRWQRQLSGETTDTQTIAALCANAAEHGVTTSTYEAGRDFNEDLMVAMGERSGGNHYYGDTAADLF
ncbi:MAG: VWA domain-containing protein [Pseudomonadales bacterium]